jgi:alanyl-tRNA synthetase
VVLAHSGDLEFHCGDMMRAALAQLGLRGGGSPDMAQGNLPNEELINFLALVTRELRNLLAEKRP